MTMVSNQSRNRREKIEFREQLEEFFSPSKEEEDFEECDYLDDDWQYELIEDNYYLNDLDLIDDYLDKQDNIYEPCNCINYVVGSYYKDEKNRTFFCCMVGMHKYLVNILTGREIDEFHGLLQKV